MRLSSSSSAYHPCSEPSARSCFSGGIVAWIAKGGTVWTSKFTALFSIPGRGTLFGFLPVPVLVLVVIFTVCLIVLEKTVAGRYFYAVGGNAKAADHAGIIAKRMKAMSFIIVGFLSAVRGHRDRVPVCVLHEQRGQRIPVPRNYRRFSGFDFPQRTACRISGGTMVACLFLQELSNGFSLLGLKYWHEDTVQGFIMILAIATMIAGKHRNK